MIGECFATIYIPGRQISFDKAMITFRGRSSLKQYMSNKPVKRGINAWMRADATTGYVYAFDVYTGKKGNEVENDLEAKAVKGLCEAL